MTTALELKIRALPSVLFVDDERSVGNSVIITLKNGYQFCDEPGCGVRGFDTLTIAHKEVKACAELMPVKT